MKKELETIEGVISERDLLLSLFTSVGYEYKKPNDVEKYFLKQGGNMEINLVVRAENAEDVLDKLREKGFVGRIREKKK